MLRYADLSAPKKLEHEHDSQELADPTWQLDRSNYTALVQIYRNDLKWPTKVDDFKVSYPNLREVNSDWNGWTRLEECPLGCQQVFYISDIWRPIGVDHVLCYEVASRDPLVLRCGARDHIENLHVDFYFPAAKKDHFAEFRERIVSFVHKLTTDGAKSCDISQ